MKTSEREILPRMTTKAIARFEEKFTRSAGGCWIWMAAKDGFGYGTLSLYGKGKAPEKAHRIAFALSGSEPGGMEVCHRCDNPSCVSPEHLFLGTHLENMLDAKRKGRMSIPSKGRSGSLNNSAKLSELDIPKIRESINRGASLTSIGNQFGVDRAIIARIRDGRLWAKF